MIISIDGASRRNGKPNCLAAGGVAIKHNEGFRVAASYEQPATNQRGEMLALISALTIATKISSETGDMDAYLITDSEYVFNTITKDWLTNWSNKGWVTADNNPVKNQDLWLRIKELLKVCDQQELELSFYHVKGHLMSIGAVTAAKILYADPTGHALYKTLWNKYEDARLKKPVLFDKALLTFERNHGYFPPVDIFKQFVVMNTVADYVAGTYADKVDSGGAS